ncbi:sn-glycerol-3-phosphate transport system permease protein UgpA [Clostridium sp. C105KSO15]|nr:sn-glycerol-3-phosphate transport system permease protein UgpA [Clostridium sp. C105KSO15]
MADPEKLNPQFEKPEPDGNGNPGGMKLKNKGKAKDLLIFALFVFPAVGFVLFSTDVPFLMNLYYSVFDWNGISKDMKFVGLQNFVNIFSDDTLFWKSAAFTLKFSVFFVVAVNIISLTVALVMSEEKKSSSVGRAFYYIPYIISLTAISLIWKFILGPGFEALYQATGWEVFHWSWLGSSKLAFFVVVIMTVWQNLGFYMVNYIAGIISVPRELIEAAKIDGANKFQVLRRVTIPLIMPAVSICMLTSLTFSFKLFDVIMVFTKGGPANSTISVAYNIYKEAFFNNRYGMATAKSLVFVVFVLMITAVQLKVTKGKEIEA